jgi:hypothetical protein
MGNYSSHAERRVQALMRSPRTLIARDPEQEPTRADLLVTAEQLDAAIGPQPIVVG